MNSKDMQEDDILDRATHALRETSVQEELPLEELDILLAVSMTALQQTSQDGDDSTNTQNPTQPAIRLVPDVPTELADGVLRETHRIEQPPSRRHVPGRIVAMLHKRSVRWLSAAVIAIAVLGGFSLFPSSSKPGTQKNQWWLGPPSVWAAEINAALEKAKIKGVTCRERTFYAAADGSGSPSSTWDKFYVSHDSYRRDIYDGDFLREIQWYVPDGGDMLQTGVRFDTKSYCILRHKGSFGQQDPVERIRFYVNLLDKADRQFGTETIDGRLCVGFELRASKYGSNHDTWVDRIWFDVNTRLAVRIEQSGRSATGKKDGKPFVIPITHTQDQFDYSPDLPANTFVPQIPEGFINVHPDDLPQTPQQPPAKQ